MDKSIKFIKGGLPLDFDAVTGFAINPEGETAIAFSGDFRDILLAIVGTGQVIVYGSTQKDPPDFTAAPTITNSYVPISLVNYSLVGASAFYAGAVGVSVAAGIKIVELDTNLLTWIAIYRSADTVDVLLTETNAL